MAEKKCKCMFAFEEGGVIATETNMIPCVWNSESIFDFISEVAPEFDKEIYEDHKGVVRGYFESDYGTVNFFVISETDIRLVFDDSRMANLAYEQLSKSVSSDYEFYRNSDYAANMLFVRILKTEEFVPEDEEFEKGGDVTNQEYSDKKRYNSTIKVGERYFDNRYDDVYTIESIKPFGDEDVDVVMIYDKGKTRTEKGSAILYHIDQKQHQLDKTAPKIQQPEQQTTNDKQQKEVWELTWEKSYGITPCRIFDAEAEKANKKKYTWYKERPFMDSKTRYQDLHKEIVKQALSEGKPVPPEVLADYPELKQQQQTTNDKQVSVDYKDFVKSFKTQNVRNYVHWRSEYARKGKFEIYIFIPKPRNYVLAISNTSVGYEGTILGEFETLEAAIEQAYANLHKLDEAVEKGTLKDIELGEHAENEKDLLKKAYDLGVEAFGRGVMRVSASDEKMMDLIKGRPVGANIELLKQWLSGWDDQNLKNARQKIEPTKPTANDKRQTTNDKQPTKINIIPKGNTAFDKQAQEFIINHLKTAKVKDKIKFSEKKADFDLFAVYDDNMNLLGFTKNAKESYQRALNSDNESFHIVRENKSGNELSYDYFTGSLFGDFHGELYNDNGILKEEVKNGVIESINNQFGISEPATNKLKNHYFAWELTPDEFAECVRRAKDSNGVYSVFDCWGNKYFNGNKFQYAKKYDWKNLEECHAFHKELVYKAHSEGKQIPDYVLEHYPELNDQKQQTSNDKQPTANDKQPTKQDYIEAIKGLEAMLEYVSGDEKKDYEDAIEGLKVMIE